VKPILGEFISGVSICRHYGHQSDLWAPLLLAPLVGWYGGPFSGSVYTILAWTWVFHPTQYLKTQKWKAWERWWRVEGMPLTHSS